MIFQPSAWAAEWRTRRRLEIAGKADIESRSAAKCRAAGFAKGGHLIVNQVMFVVRPLTKDPTSPGAKAFFETFCAFLEKNAPRGWKSVEDFRGLRRDRVVPQSQIRRPNPGEYHGGHEAEGYAVPEARLER